LTLRAPLGARSEHGSVGSEPLASIRSDPGNVSLNTMLTEISRPEAVRTIALPVGVFAEGSLVRR
jgi:hypothetical protein